MLDVDADEAWVREIGPSNNVSGGLGWLPDNRRLWFLAEHDGWMHLYTVDVTAERAERKQLTSGRSRSTPCNCRPDG